MSDAGQSAVSLAHRIGLTYLRHGQPHRAIVLLIVASHAAPHRTDVLVTLAASMISVQLGDQAMTVLDRIESIDLALSQQPLLQRLRARALLILGRVEEARTLIRNVL
jgi:type III secretion protein Y